MSRGKLVGIGGRIRERREQLGISRTDFAKAIGYKNIAELEAGVKVKRPKKLKEIADALHTPEDWLLTGEGPRDRDAVTMPTKLEVVSAGIKELDARAGLGGGGVIEGREVMHNGQWSDPIKDERWRFPTSFVRHEVKALETQILIIETQGDSMSPTINSGDRVIVDTRHTLPSPDGLYALRDRFGTIVVKRLQLLRAGDQPRLKIISDNNNHKDEEVGADEIAIVGRVLWGLKRL